jgi:hypothetical protein
MAQGAQRGVQRFYKRKKGGFKTRPHDAAMQKMLCAHIVKLPPRYTIPSPLTLSQPRWADDVLCRKQARSKIINKGNEYFL